MYPYWSTYPPRIKVMLQTKHGVIPEFKWSILSRGAGILADPISYMHMNAYQLVIY